MYLEVACIGSCTYDFKTVLDIYIYIYMQGLQNRRHARPDAMKRAPKTHHVCCESAAGACHENPRARGLFGTVLAHNKAFVAVPRRTQINKHFTQTKSQGKNNKDT